MTRTRVAALAVAILVAAQHRPVHRGADREAGPVRPRRRTWRPLHGRLWNLFRRPRRSLPGEWARPRRPKTEEKS